MNRRPLRRAGSADGAEVAGGGARSAEDRLSQLEKIKKLLDSGAVTPEECARENARLL